MSGETRKRWRRANRLASAGHRFYWSRMRTLQAMKAVGVVMALAPPGRLTGMPMTYLGCEYAASLALDGCDVRDLP